MTSKPEKISADVALFSIAFVWALNFTVIKASLTEIDPYSFNALRFILAAGFIWIVIYRKKAWFRVNKEDWKGLIPLALIGNLLYQWLFIAGIDLTLAANAALMLGTIPIWVAVLSHFTGFEKLNRITFYGVLLAFCGIGLIIFFGKEPISFGSDTFTGDLAILAAAVVWAVFTIYSKSFLTRYTPLQLSAFMTTCGAIVLTALAVPFAAATEWGSVSWAGWSGVAYSGILAIGLAYIIWNNGIMKVGAVRTATYQNMVPVLGLFFGIILLNETLQPLQYTGAAVVIGGILITRYSQRITL
ncbi:MAG: DMT family transporter [Balneolaceae bacterium]|nr:MAG: DMT family transporter [Balneolaceae bacterium]